MRVTLIHNAEAGDDDQVGERELQEVIRTAGHTVRYVSCSDENWHTALTHPADLIAVAGGDGTLGRVAKAVMGRPVPLTALPLGTANNISKTLGLTDAPLPTLVRGWAHAHRAKFDVGIARGPWGTRYFIEGMGAGLFASMIPHAEDNKTISALHRADAKVAYALQLLRERAQGYPAAYFNASIDGRDLSGEYILLEAMNMQYVGPNLYLAPACDLRDGLVDVVAIPACERGKLDGYLATWQNGKLRAPELPTYRGHELRLQWSGYPVHIDDESWPADAASCSTRYAAIEVTMAHTPLEFLIPCVDQMNSVSTPV